MSLMVHNNGGNRSVDVGEVTLKDMSDDTRFLKCDGSDVSAADYPLLADKLFVFAKKMDTAKDVSGIIGAPSIALAVDNTFYVFKGKLCYESSDGENFILKSEAAYSGYGPYYIPETDEIILGDYATGNCSISDDNGATWRNITLPQKTIDKGIMYFKGKYYVTGGTGSSTSSNIYSSDNLETWTMVHTVGQAIEYLIAGCDYAYFSSQKSTADTLRTPDGVNFYWVTNYALKGRGIRFGDDLFVTDLSILNKFTEKNDTRLTFSNTNANYSLPQIINDATILFPSRSFQAVGTYFANRGFYQLKTVTAWPYNTYKNVTCAITTESKIKFLTQSGHILTCEKFIQLPDFGGAAYIRVA